jgi:hypothetical protein
MTATDICVIDTSSRLINNLKLHFAIYQKKKKKKTNRLINNILKQTFIYYPLNDYE